MSCAASGAAIAIADASALRRDGSIRTMLKIVAFCGVVRLNIDRATLTFIITPTPPPIFLSNPLTTSSPTPPCRLFIPRWGGTISSDTQPCRVFKQDDSGLLEQTSTESARLRDLCRHARWERDRVEISDHVTDDIQTNIELVLVVVPTCPPLIFHSPRIDAERRQVRERSCMRRRRAGRH